MTAALLLAARFLTQSGDAEELRELVMNALEDGSLFTASVSLELGAPATALTTTEAEMLPLREEQPESGTSVRNPEFPIEKDEEGNGDPTPDKILQPEESAEPAPEEEPEPSLPDAPGVEVLSTTITGGLRVTNDTSQEVDVQALLAEGPSQRLPADSPQILIIHTHGTEAYTPDGTDIYEATDTFRTTDAAYSVIRVGDELTEALRAQGLNVIHDRGLYDYPSYTGSYGRSGAAVESYLSEYPDIAIVIDLHRDALGTGDVVYKTVAELEGGASAQVMLLVGTGENGLAHPMWKENLKLALALQASMEKVNRTLARPVALKSERYNQHLTTGSLILEVGSSGNTLEEALCAIRLFAQAAGPVFQGLL